VILLISFLALVFYSIGSQLAALVQDWPSFKEQFHGSLNNLQNWLATHLHVDVQKQKNYINNEASKVLSSNRALVGSTLLSLTSIIFFFSLSTIFTFFLLLYRKLLLGFIIAVFPEKSSGLIYDIVETVYHWIAIGDVDSGYARLRFIFDFRGQICPSFWFNCGGP
jgi:predicted PurR-regulated permease PerM